MLISIWIHITSGQSRNLEQKESDMARNINVFHTILSKLLPDLFWVKQILATKRNWLIVLAVGIR